MRVDSRARQSEGVVLRRSTKIAAASAAALLALAGCAEDDKETNTGTTSKALDCRAAEGDGPKVGLAYDVGGQGDKSFNDSAAVGAKKAVDEVEDRKSVV